MTDIGLTSSQVELHPFLSYVRLNTFLTYALSEVGEKVDYQKLYLTDAMVQLLTILHYLLSLISYWTFIDSSLV